MENNQEKFLIDIIDVSKEKNVINDMLNKEDAIVVLKKYVNPEAIVLHGFDNALIGYDTNHCLTYDLGLMLTILMKRDGISSEDAMEYIDSTFVNGFDGWEFKPNIVMLSPELLMYSLDKRFEEVIKNDK